MVYSLNFRAPVLLLGSESWCATFGIHKDFDFPFDFRPEIISGQISNLYFRPEFFFHDLKQYN